MSAALLLRAIDFAAFKHRHQRRKDAEELPYINHPVAVARLLAVEADIDDLDILMTAVLHDVLEDTNTHADEIGNEFGNEVRELVLEVSDDKSLPKQRRKAIQVDKAATSSMKARLVKLADKICNLRDLSDHPPAGWDIERRREYFDWAKAVVDQLGDVHPVLQELFEREFARRP